MLMIYLQWDQLFVIKALLCYVIAILGIDYKYMHKYESLLVVLVLVLLCSVSVTLLL